MADINLENMSLAELKALRKEIDRALKSHEAQMRTEALAMAEAKVAEIGFSLRDLVRIKKPKKKNKTGKQKN